MIETKVKFHVGQLVRHQLFGYRGAVYDVDPVYANGEEWYEQMARSRPPKDRPWYHVLVHDHSHTTYVAECNLAPDTDGGPIDHPAVELLFAEFRDGRYLPLDPVN